MSPRRGPLVVWGAGALLAVLALVAPTSEPRASVLTVRTGVVRPTRPPVVETTSTTVPPTTTTVLPPTTTSTTRPPPPPTTVVVTAPQPVPTGDCYGHADAVAARWPPGEHVRACRIIGCESGGSPTADNPSSSASGVWQVLDGTWNGYGGYARALHAPVSVQHDFAYGLWSRSGWGPWSCS